MNTSSVAAIGACALTALAGSAAGAIIDFDTLVHGEIVTNQFQASHGVTISAVNPNRSFDIAAAFDTLQTGTADPDLEGPPWAGGNLPSTMVMGRVLFLAENNTGAGDGILDNPDDEGLRPAGDLIFSYNFSIDNFGFDIIDVEGTAEFGSIEFRTGGAILAIVPMANFVTNNGNPFYDPTVAFGNNTINRLAPITASQVGGVFDEVIIHMGGSGAVDNVIPAPATPLLASLGAFSLLRRRRTNR